MRQDCYQVVEYAWAAIVLHMRKVCSRLLVMVLLVVSSAPLVPAGAFTGAPQASDCHFSHMKVASTGHAKHAMTPAMRNCRIECCGHHGSDGLPHQLAPHTVSLAGFGAGLFISAIAATNLPVLKPRLLPLSVPPPRYT